MLGQSFVQPGCVHLIAAHLGIPPLVGDLVDHAGFHLAPLVPVEIQADQVEAGVLHTIVAQRSFRYCHLAEGIGAKSVSVDPQCGCGLVQSGLAGRLVRCQVIGTHLGSVGRCLGHAVVGAGQPGELAQQPARDLVYPLACGVLGLADDRAGGGQRQRRGQCQVDFVQGCVGKDRVAMGRAVSSYQAVPSWTASSG